MISCVVLTKNEENNIVDCLESVSFCDEIIVVDDYSKDNTIEIIKNYNDSGHLSAEARRIGGAQAGVRMTEQKIKIYERHLDVDFSKQRNYGLGKAKGEWVLFVDADERVTPELAKEIKQKISNGFWTPARRSRLLRRSGYEGRVGAGGSQNDEKNYNGFYIRRKDFLFGRWLKYGETKDIKFIRLIRKGRGQWERKVHERVGGFPPSPRLRRTGGVLGEPLLHYPHQTIDEFLRKINFYTDLNVEILDSRFRGNDKWVGLSVLIYPLAKFMQNYFLKLGFLDGMAGFLQATLMSFHSFLTRGKLWEMTKKIC